MVVRELYLAFSSFRGGPGVCIGGLVCLEQPEVNFLF